jgi:hypothetical protein
VWPRRSHRIPRGRSRATTQVCSHWAVEAAGMSHREVKARMRELGRQHGVRLPDAYLELQSRLVKDEAFYRHHPVHAVWWLLRHSRPSTLMRRWQELRTGTFTFAA